MIIVGNEWWEAERIELIYGVGAAVPLNESEVVDRSRTFGVRRCRLKLRIVWARTKQNGLQR